MGGYSSGRRDGGPLVEDGWKLDLSHCVRNGLILPGRYVAGSMKWTLTSTARSTGAKVERDYRVPLETNRPNYGGLRWRFVCPLSGRRARVLYLPGSGGSVFVNRQAWRLACQSQRQGVEDRAVERSLKASKRLGVEDRNMLEMPHCPRTKWMRQRTHRRLVGVIRKCHRMQMAYMARRRPGVRPHKSSHNSAAERGASPCSYCGGCDANTPGGPPCTCASDGQTTDNQRRVLMEVAGRRGWTVATTYEGAGISGVKGRDKRPGFDAMLRDATRRRFDVLLFWSMDRLDRSTAAVTNALAELDAAGVAIYADKEAMDATTPHGRAMLQMAAEFAELERSMIRERVMAGLARVRVEGKKKLGRPMVGKKVEDAIRARLSTGDGMLKVSKALGVGVSTVMRVRGAMHQTLVAARWQRANGTSGGSSRRAP